jgi:ubiquitin-like modifier-activating enzyme ATG7
MWGVRNITMLDRGNVSYSNPVRQTLFDHADCLKTGEDRIKSVAAAAALRRILPTVNARGVNLEIRMPGHRIDDAAREQATKDIDALRALITSHDVCYLLTDSREARWLPTLMCMAHDVPCINAALAFDSYLVMRHGLRGQGAQQVGCYFCNDVVAPIDSLSARSLDQQCTVTRPGVSAMASALAVELLASLLNHPRRFLCPAWIDEDSPAFDKEVDSPERECSTVLGILPHQLRGNINATYGCTVMHGRAFTKCTACSPSVCGAYTAGGTKWVIDVINEPGLLERTSGLEADRQALEDIGGDDDFGFADE